MALGVSFIWLWPFTQVGGFFNGIKGHCGKLLEPLCWLGLEGIYLY